MGDSVNMSLTPRGSITIPVSLGPLGVPLNGLKHRLRILNIPKSAKHTRVALRRVVETSAPCDRDVVVAIRDLLGRVQDDFGCLC